MSEQVGLVSAAEAEDVIRRLNLRFRRALCWVKRFSTRYEDWTEYAPAATVEQAVAR